MANRFIRYKVIYFDEVICAEIENSPIHPIFIPYVVFYLPHSNSYDIDFFTSMVNLSLSNKRTEIDKERLGVCFLNWAK